MNEHEQGDRRMELIIGILLRLGVMLAGSVVLFGAVVYLIRNGAAALPDYKSFHGESAQLSTVEGILSGVWQFRGRAIIQLGVLLLIATPVARVVFAVVAFALEKDKLYVCLTLIVLAILMFSLLSSVLG
ncbi:MAG: DUF1634 domain-containing protein [Candidatus Korobacteraceae bacterium]|jgi:uncharacterized membrane protein